MADGTEAALRAIDAGFEAQVSQLFRVVCEGQGDPPGALQRFERGMDNAISAREDARKIFTE